MRGPKKVSQTQLARELGISQALVSLVLNGRRHGINAETYDRVWAHAVKRGYHPKGMHLASSPAAQAQQVGVVLRAPLRLDRPTPFFSHVQQGLYAGIDSREFTTVFLGAEDQLNPEKLRRIFGPGHAYRGVVLLGEMSRGFLDQIRRLGLRTVCVAARYPGFCHSILGNDTQALEWVVDHLREFGHRRFGWLGGNVGLGGHEARLQAFEAALGRIGLKLESRYTVKTPEAERADGADAIRAVLPFSKRKDFPTAFVAYNMPMAMGAVRELERDGWPVPAAISVASAGFMPQSDDGLRITAAGPNPEKLGEAAARLLLELPPGSDGEFTDLTLPAQVVVGETTGPAR